MVGGVSSPERKCCRWKWMSRDILSAKKRKKRTLRFCILLRGELVGFFGDQIFIVGVLNKTFLLPVGARVKSGWLRRLNTSLKECPKMEYLNVRFCFTRKCVYLLNKNANQLIPSTSTPGCSCDIRHLCPNGKRVDSQQGICCSVTIQYPKISHYNVPECHYQHDTGE